MSLASGDPRHGTANGYGNLECRCDACRAANTEYNRAHNTGGFKRDLCECGASKLAKSTCCQACYDAAREAPHGTEGRYKRCRCELCRAAAREGKRRRRERSRVPCVSCGTLVVSINRDNPDRPLECHACATAHANWERRRAAR